MSESMCGEEFMEKLTRDFAEMIARRVTDEIVVYDYDVLPDTLIDNCDFYSKLIDILEEEHDIMLLVTDVGNYFIKKKDYEYFSSVSEDDAEDLDDKKRRAWKIVDRYNSYHY